MYIPQSYIGSFWDLHWSFEFVVQITGPKYPIFEVFDPKSHLPGPPKEPEIMAQYPKIDSMGSIGSIILAFLEVQERQTTCQSGEVS